jgi:type VI protein secretion system component VasK
MSGTRAASQFHVFAPRAILGPMDREEAHKILGLYLGASNTQIEAKFAELSAAEPARADQLTIARDTALGRPTQVIAKPTPVLRRGPVVLLMIVLALAICTGLFFAAAKYLDNEQAKRRTGEQRDKVAAAHDAWAKYRAATGAGQNSDGTGADELYAGAVGLLAQGDHENAAKDLETALQLYNSAFKAEDARIAQAWQRDVLDFRRDKLAGKFPFDRETEVEAEADDVARLLNPASGALWAITREHDALAAVELEGRHFAQPLDGREALVKAGAPLRDALFGAHSPTIDVRFQISIGAPKAIAELRLEVGGAVCSTRKEGMQAAHWIQADCGLKLTRAAWGNDSKDVTHDRSTSDWGLLRVLAFGEFIGERDGALVWEYDPDNITGRKTRGKDATIHIKPEAGRNPFDLALYEALAR